MGNVSRLCSMVQGVSGTHWGLFTGLLLVPWSSLADAKESLSLPHAAIYMLCSVPTPSDQCWVLFIQWGRTKLQEQIRIETLGQCHVHHWPLLLLWICLLFHHHWPPGPCYNLKPSPRAAPRWAKSHKSPNRRCWTGADNPSSPPQPSPRRTALPSIIRASPLLISVTGEDAIGDVSLALAWWWDHPVIFNWLPNIHHWTLPCHGNTCHNFWKTFVGFRAALQDSEQPQ